MNTIKHIRTVRLKLSQSQLAEICGVNQTTVGRWERGEFLPSLKQALALQEFAAERGVTLSLKEMAADETHDDTAQDQAA